MKIFEFDWFDDRKDWVMAHDMIKAKELYINLTGCGNLVGCYCVEVDESEWEGLYILDINTYDEDMEDSDNWINGYKVEMSFAEYARTNSSADIICTTEF